MKKLKIIVASVGKNLELSAKVKEAADAKGFETEVISLVDLNLPLYTTPEQKNGIPEAAVNLRDNLIESDALFFVAPEYNGSLPPTLNNMIAWVSVSDKDWRKAFNGKPAVISTFSGGGGAHVLMAMRQQLSYIGANVVGRDIQTNFGKELNPDSLDACLGQLLK